MMSFKRLDVAAELQNLRSTPAKVAKPAKPSTPEISNFSRFSRGDPAKLQNPGQQQAAASNRDFLSRPLDQQDNPDPRDAWAPFMSWLSEHHLGRFTAICRAEESLKELERQGITEGPDYEQACATLLWVFEEARRLKLSQSVKVWMQ